MIVGAKADTDKRDTLPSRLKAIREVSFFPRTAIRTEPAQTAVGEIDVRLDWQLSS